MNVASVLQSEADKRARPADSGSTRSLPPKLDMFVRNCVCQDEFRHRLA
jgi:hypothetical protein